ncbi:MAG: hypothetical protein ACLFP9_06090 [Desulfonatronovibrio sp.]
MLELVRASVCPKPEMVAVVNAGLEALCTHIRYPADKTRRLQLATEEIFLYALNTIHKASLRSILTVRFRSHANGFQIVVEYVGPRGELDGYLKPGQLQSLKVNGFDAVGLCLAANVLDYLKSTYWTVEGINCYLLSQNFPCTLTYST